MTEESRVAFAPEGSSLERDRDRTTPLFEKRYVLVAAALVALYWRSVWEMSVVWSMEDSYYSHGYLVPFISLGIAWLKRKEVMRAPRQGTAWGFAWVAAGLLMLLFGDFLGFRVFGQLSLIPVLTGVFLLFLGTAATKALWFPLAFLVFMVPIPPSLTQSVALHLKLLAAEGAVQLARLMTLPMVREGSFIHFNGDKLLIGEVCGGLRSLISLLAIGALATYFSRTRPWARIFLLVMSVPIAIVSNVVRIFLLCVVGYFYGSETAASPKVHDTSGILIFVVAFVLFFALESWLRRVAPQDPAPDAPPPAPTGPAPSPRRRWTRFAVLMAALLAVMAGHFAILDAQAEAAREVPVETIISIPDRIGMFKQAGTDVEVEDKVKRALETSSILIRAYRSQGGWPVELTIVYAGKTRRSLHFPEICLTGGGWDIMKQESTPVGIQFQARRLVLVKGEQRQAVLYWFKTGDELTGNYFVNALYWARNQLTFGTPTSAMIKLTTPIEKGPRGEEAAFTLLETFAMQFTPMLRERVP